MNLSFQKRLLDTAMPETVVQYTYHSFDGIFSAVNRNRRLKNTPLQRSQLAVNFGLRRNGIDTLDSFNW